ncbi:MAG: four helix bundle protein [Candidatus Gracilibacteria bacterium]
MTENIITQKSEDFALSCIRIYQALQNEGEFILSKQLLRSGTSIGANIAEANSSQSKKDFFSKVCIAYKEAHETQYWIGLLQKSSLTQQDLIHIKDDCQEIIRILAKIKITTETNLKENI